MQGEAQERAHDGEADAPTGCRSIRGVFESSHLFTHEPTLAFARSTRLEEGVQEGVGQGGDLDNRHQTGACDLPE